MRSICFLVNPFENLFLLIAVFSLIVIVIVIVIHCSVAKSCLILCNFMNCSRPGFPVLHYLLELAQTPVHWVDDAIHISSSAFPFSSCPQFAPNISVFSNESALWIRWPKHWNFSVTISPSSEYSGLISFRIDWFDLLAIQGTLQHHNSKASNAALQITQNLTA